MASLETKMADGGPTVPIYNNVLRWYEDIEVSISFGILDYHSLNFHAPSQPSREA